MKIVYNQQYEIQTHYNQFHPRSLTCFLPYKEYKISLQTSPFFSMNFLKFQNFIARETPTTILLCSYSSLYKVKYETPYNECCCGRARRTGRGWLKVFIAHHFSVKERRSLDIRGLPAILYI